MLSHRHPAISASSLPGPACLVWMMVATWWTVMVMVMVMMMVWRVVTSNSNFLRSSNFSLKAVSR